MSQIVFFFGSQVLSILYFTGCFYHHHHPSTFINWHWCLYVYHIAKLSIWNGYFHLDILNIWKFAFVDAQLCWKQKMIKGRIQGFVYFERNQTSVLEGRITDNTRFWKLGRSKTTQMLLTEKIFKHFTLHKHFKLKKGHMEIMFNGYVRVRKMYSVALWE